MPASAAVHAHIYVTQKGFSSLPQRENMPWPLRKKKKEKKAEVAEKQDKKRFHELVPPGPLSYIVAARRAMW